MSSINLSPSVACPSCAAVLAADELLGGGPAICAHCGHHFLFQPGGDTRRLSRKAVASLVLGVASLLFFCLTAIPALILGGLALIDLHRHEDGLRGRKLAVAGIVLSVLFGFLSLIVWALLLPAIQMLLSRQAAAFG